ncbi:hypothetical protein C8Q80DRAFT_1222748 [Daedaleopsis nitida]|nr:hypothetical protein C8Q80DRAFT_1222748 [Daedaleopsis nitida]
MSPLFDFPDADLVLRSSSPPSDADIHHYPCVDFRVHRCVLSAASSFFEAMLSLPQPSTESRDTLPIIPFTETAAVLEILLRYVYPVSDPVIGTLDESVPALEAARKYDVTVAIDGLRRRLVAPEFLTASPLRVYAIASRYELEDEARTASHATLDVGLHDLPLHADLKGMSGYAYHQLLLLHERRARSALALLKLPADVACMLCNGRHGAVDGPPKWWGVYRERAAEELRVRPTARVQAARGAGCERCAGSILASYWFFEDLRRDIDALPATV